MECPSVLYNIIISNRNWSTRLCLFASYPYYHLQECDYVFISTIYIVFL